MSISNATLPSFLLILALLAPAFEASAQETPAQFFPPDTLLYLQANPPALCEGVQSLKLMKLLEDPGLAGVFDQAVGSIPPDMNPQSILEQYPMDKALGASIAIGMVGFKIRYQEEGGEGYTTLRIPAESPVTPELQQAIFRGSCRIDGDPLIVMEVADKPLFIRTAAQMVGNLFFGGEPPMKVTEEVDGVEMSLWTAPIEGSDALYTTFIGPYFLATGHPGNLKDAILRVENRSASLASRSDFLHFEEHRRGKNTGAILHLGLHDLLELIAPFIPPADLEELNRWGALDVSGLQMGFGFHEGGICEWFHLGFAEDAEGVFMNLLRLYPRVGLVEKLTDRGTVYGAALSFDWSALYKVVIFILDLCEVDTTEFTSEIKAASGLNLEEDILAAVGSRMGALAVMPHYGFIPETSLVLSVRNQEKMEALLHSVEELVRQIGWKTKKFTIPGGGPKGTYIDMGQEVPVKPAYALCNGNLVLSAQPLMLKYALTKSASTGLSSVDLLTRTVIGDDGPLMSYYFDPAPAAMNLYADFLKVLGSGGIPNLPIDPTQLPSPEFIADALSRIGFEFSVDPYFFSVDLHSPAGIVLPVMIGSAVFQAMEMGTVKSSNI